jgi:chromosome segregation ATPase
MWLPDKSFDLFRISKDTVDFMREELASLKAERDGLKTQLANTQANFEWLRVKVNSLEMERASLLEKVYGMKIPVPEIARQPVVPQGFNSDLFEDVGEKMAKELGFPTYSSPFQNQ